MVCVFLVMIADSSKPFAKQKLDYKVNAKGERELKEKLGPPKWVSWAEALGSKGGDNALRWDIERDAVRTVFDSVLGRAGPKD